MTELESGSGSAAGSEQAPLTVDHAADFYRRYPGEPVTLYARVGVQQTVPGFTLRVAVPAGLVVDDYQVPPGLGHPLPTTSFMDGVRQLTWRVTGELEAGASWEYRIQTHVASLGQDTTLESRATVALQSGESEVVSATETVAIAVLAKGQYLRHLPALYQQDELMGRFLMLFESFWAPIERQIDTVSLYFDPKMAPPDFLPWLASWLDLVLDERLSEERQRQLIRSAVSLYRKRGTRQGLLDYLEILTGVRAQIVEHRASDFRLGPEARLGPGIALGTGNWPHTFTVTLHLPPISLPDGDESERARLDRERRRVIEAIIEAEKPAHTAYTLRIETLPADGQV